MAFYHQAKFWFSSYGPKSSQSIKLQDFLTCNISRKKWMMKFVFGLQIKIKVSCKLILSFWVWPTGHPQSTQNKEFAYLCNISWNTWGWSWFFCLQINTSLQYLCKISRKMWRMNFIFCLQVNVKGFFKLLLSF